MLYVSWKLKYKYIQNWVTSEPNHAFLRSKIQTLHSISTCNSVNKSPQCQSLQNKHIVCMTIGDKVGDTESHWLVQLQGCWSKPGTNNREFICLPPASRMRDVWGNHCSCISGTAGTRGVDGGEGVVWKRPSVSITHQKPALKYHYSCTSQFASTVTSEMMSGSESKSQKEKTGSVSLLTTVNEGEHCKNVIGLIFRWKNKWSQRNTLRFMSLNVVKHNNHSPAKYKVSRCESGVQENAHSLHH